MASMGLNKYPAYKDSGVEWIGEIPETWRVQKLKHIGCVNLSNVDKKSKEDEQEVRLCNYVDVYYNDFITPNMDFMQATASSEQIDKFTLQQGDVLITKDSEDWDDIAVPAYVSQDYDDVVCGYHLAHIRPLGELIDGRYLFRSFNANPLYEQFKVSANGITRYGVGKYSIENALFLLPSPDEQQAIADYLDKKTVLIDDLIGKKRRQIELLKEQRQAVINQAVTKGLDPNVEMKDSGIEWLGEIPKHWEVVKLKYLGEAILGLTYSPEDVVQDETEGMLVLRASNIQNRKLSLEDNVYVKAAVPKKLITQIGDILICSRSGSRRLIGKSICIDDNSKGCTFGAFMTIFRSEYWRFLLQVLNSSIFTSQAGLYLTSTINQLTVSTLKNFVIAIPPSFEEQQAVADFVEEKSEDIENGIAKAQMQIQLLQEYRTALISEAVTGKIDVREAV